MAIFRIPGILGDPTLSAYTVISVYALTKRTVGLFLPVQVLAGRISIGRLPSTATFRSDRTGKAHRTHAYSGRPQQRRTLSTRCRRRLGRGSLRAAIFVRGNPSDARYGNPGHRPGVDHGHRKRSGLPGD